VDVAVEMGQPTAGQRGRCDDGRGDGVLMGAHWEGAGHRGSVTGNVHNILRGSVVLPICGDGSRRHGRQNIIQVLHEVGDVF